jgi:hypothetical protein
MSKAKTGQTAVDKIVTKLRSSIKKSQPRNAAVKRAAIAPIMMSAVSTHIIEEIRHRAAIAGYVTDAHSGQTIANAVVELVGQNLLAQTRSDGFYYFLDLAVGQYALNISAPLLATRYGVIAGRVVNVQNAADGRPIFDPNANVGLPPTRLIGKVIRSDDDLPIAKASVRLLGSESKTLTDANGRYVLSGLQAGMPTVQASADGFVTTNQKVTLIAGQETTINLSLAFI